MNRFMLLFLPFMAVALPAEELKLEQALQMALQHNYTLANSALDVAKVDDRIGSTRTRQFPNTTVYLLGAQQLTRFDFTIPRGTLGLYSIGPIPNQDVHFENPIKPTGFAVARIVQPLSTLHRIRLNLKLLETSKELAKEQVRANRQDVVRDVKRLYYGIQQVEAGLKATHETLELYRELGRLVAKYVEQQTALKGEQLDVQTRLAKTEATQLSLLNQESAAKEQLNALLGRDVMADFTVTAPDETNDSEMELAAARARALEMRPELRQARLKIQQAEQDVRVKRSEYIPDISAEFNSIALLNFNAFLPTQTTSVGFSLSWEPFDWGRRRHEIAEKQRTVEQARNTETDARNKITIDINGRYRAVQLARAQFRVTRLGQQTALENLRVAQKKYELQGALLKDVLQSQATLEQANSEYQRALSDFWTARAEFERALGEDR